jgi:hypothetical protein
MATVPRDWWPTIRRFESKADRMVEGLPLRLTSWGRSRARNAAVGGKPRSQHLVWTAADFAGPTWAKDEARRRARSLGLIAFDEGDHLHVQLFPAGVIGDDTYDRVSS